MANDRIRTSHVGSLIRTPKLVEFMHAIDEERPYDQATFDACLTASVEDVVHRQVEAGIDIVSDGEYGKTGSWSRYIEPRLEGVAIRPLNDAELADPIISPHGELDREKFRDFYREYDHATGFDKRMGVRFSVTGPIKYKGQTLLQRDIANLKAAARKTGAVGAFLPVVAPASALPIPDDQHYGDDEKMLNALADALHQEYQAIVDAGLNVQVDDAFLPYMYEKMVPAKTPKQYRKWAELRIAALNRALKGIPPERSRYHICWGSWNGPHAFDMPLRDIVDLLVKINVGALSFEAANPRHQHEWKAWEGVKIGDKTLMPGVVTHSTNIVEHPELVAERLERYARIVGREKVLAGTDCGFAQSPFARRVHPTIQWAKLQSLSEGASLASLRLWSKPKKRRVA